MSESKSLSSSRPQLIKPQALAFQWNFNVRLLTLNFIGIQNHTEAFSFDSGRNSDNYILCARKNLGVCNDIRADCLQMSTIHDRFKEQHCILTLWIHSDNFTSLFMDKAAALMAKIGLRFHRVQIY